MRRVVVTGLGLVTPLGADVETTWANLLAGKSGAGKITRFDASDQKCHIACEVKPKDHPWGFDPDKRVDHKIQRQVIRSSSTALMPPGRRWKTPA
jgi:3-oxoacyl-[acyl-carrier-protein] synthase II